MKSGYYYRFICKNIGIYEAVDRDCPRDDERRKAKPDGSWLPKVGLQYPGAISFWTKQGLKKYMETGLFQWHYLVVQEPVQVIMCTEIEESLYVDDYQVICEPPSVKQKKVYEIDEFLQMKEV